MKVIAGELYKKSNLKLYALPLWIGNHRTGYDIVLFDDAMAPGKRTIEDAEKLRKLEELLKSMAILTTDKPKLGTLCSAACWEYPLEPLAMMKRRPPPGSERDVGREIVRLMDELDAIYRCALSSWTPIPAVLRWRQHEVTKEDLEGGWTGKLMFVESGTRWIACMSVRVSKRPVSMS